MTDANTQDAGWVWALLEERRGYDNNPDKKDRLAAVDAELAKYGVAVGKDGDVDMPAELQAELAPVDAGAVETSTIETTDANPDKKPAAKPKRAAKKAAAKKAAVKPVVPTTPTFPGQVVDTTSVSTILQK